MSNLGVWYNDCDYVVADSAEEANAIWAKHIGEDPSEYELADWRPLPGDKVVRGSEEDDDEANFETLTCAEWAGRKNGETRLLFSEDY